MPEHWLSKLEDLETQWSVVRKAHVGDSSDEAMRSLVIRYSAAIRRFARFLTTSDDEADDVAQDAILRLLKGDFAGADPNQGRFRDFLRAALRNMVRSRWATVTRQAKHLQKLAVQRGEDVDTDETNWDKAWQATVLEHAWQQLKEFEDAHEGNRYHRLLRLRVDHADWTYQQLSDSLVTTGMDIEPANLRQQIHRARTKFAEFIVQEIVQGLDSSERDRVQEELVALGLYEQV